MTTRVRTGGPVPCCCPQAYSFPLAALSGLLQVLVFPRFGFTWLALVAVAPLLIACARVDAWRTRFLVGWLAGSIYWGGACYWIYGVMHSYADLSAPGAGAIFIAFFLYKGLYLAVFSVAAGPLLKRAWAIPVVTALWVSFEGLHQYLAFTWLQLGNAGIDMPLLPRLAPLTGIYGLSFVLAMVNAAGRCPVPAEVAAGGALAGAAVASASPARATRRCPAAGDSPAGSAQRPPGRASIGWMGPCAAYATPSANGASLHGGRGGEGFDTTGAGHLARIPRAGLLLDGCVDPRSFSVDWRRASMLPSSSIPSSGEARTASSR